jgi:hypothetical protein
MELIKEETAFTVKGFLGIILLNMKNILERLTRKLGHAFTRSENIMFPLSQLFYQKLNQKTREKV